MARAIGRLLLEERQPLTCVASRSSESAIAAAEFLGSGVAAVGYSELPARASRILICVADSAVETVAEVVRPGRGILLHTCGAKGPEAVRGTGGGGVSCGALHPFQTFSGAGAEAVRGVSFAVAGDAEAVSWAGEIVQLAGGRMLRIRPDARPLYHAAAVMASNYVTSLLAAAQELLAAAGVEPEDILPALGPLSGTSLENALRCGPAHALTGPIRRGDSSTVSAHLAALTTMPGVLTDFYRAAGAYTVKVAMEGGLSKQAAATIGQLLSIE